MENGRYMHVCFYCDMIYESDELLDSVLLFCNYYNCTHNFQPMVGLRDKRWNKCINCYQIQEHYHSYLHDYEYYNSTQHKSRCSCGEFILENHVWTRTNNVYNYNFISTYAAIAGPKICKYCGVSTLS